MPIVFSCAGCKKKYEVGDHLAGKMGRCKQCGSQFRIPVPRTLTPPPAPKAPPPSDLLDDFQEEDTFPEAEDLLGPAPDQEDDLAPPVASFGSRTPVRATPEAKKKKKKKKSGSGGATGALANLPLPIMILGGGGTLLVLFLTLVVVPSMHNVENQADLVDQAVAAAQVPAPVAAHVAPEADAAPIAADVAPTAADPAPIAADVAPTAPAAPRAVTAGPPPDLSKYPALPALPASLVPRPAPAPGSLRDLSGHEQKLTEGLGLLNEMSEALESVRNRQSGDAVEARLEGIAERLKQIEPKYAHLFQPTPDEQTEILKRHLTEVRATMNRLKSAVHMAGIRMGQSRQSMQLSRQISSASFALEQAAAASAPPPYVEVFVSDIPDQDTADVVVQKLKDAGNAGSLTSQLAYDPSGHSLSARLWPVDDASSLAGHIGFGQASVSGRQITLTGVSIPAHEVAASKAKLQAEEARKRIASSGIRSQDPQPPADADALTVALFQLKSSDQGTVRRGLETLARTAPEESRKAEVASVIDPLVLDSDAWTAEAAVKAVGNWPTPEGIKALINAVERDDRRGVRHAAMKKLGELKEPSAAPAIASRLKEDSFEATPALRALGPAAESAVIPLLSSSESSERKAACEILKDIGGQATLDVMKTLPADPDTFVRMSAGNAMKSINSRLNSQRKSIGKLR